MIWSRRGWIQCLLGGVSLCAFLQRSANAKGSGVRPRRSGTVSKGDGTGIPDLVVEIIDPDGGVATTTTDKNGDYRLTAPGSGPFIITFREAQGSTRLLDVRQLTAGTDQMLSVTLDPAIDGFSGIYSALQGVEGLCAWLNANQENLHGNKQLSQRLSLPELIPVVANLVKNLRAFVPDAERIFLDQKATAIRKLVADVDRNLKGLAN